MKTNLSEIKRLYQKYLDKSATTIEFDQLFEHLRNPENLEILKEEMSQEWISHNSGDAISPVLWQEIEMEIRKRKAQERKESLERQSRLYRWAVAASFLLIIGLAVGMYLFNREGAFKLYATGYGEVQKIILDDGSQVTLNANSTLEWDNNWQESGHRTAIITGEAYFNVESIKPKESDVKMGFDVVTRDLTIQVIGTAFNVKSRTVKTDVYLDEGLIHLNLKDPDDSDKEGNDKKEVVMKPGESVSYSSSTKKLDRAESDRYGNASWMAGTFMYNNQLVKDIFQSLEEIYGVEFQVNDEALMNRKLTTNLPYSDWPIVESALQLLLHIQIEKRESTIIINKRE